MYISIEDYREFTVEASVLTNIVVLDSWYNCGIGYLKKLQNHVVSCWGPFSICRPCQLRLTISTTLSNYHIESLSSQEELWLLPACNSNYHSLSIRV